MTNEHQVIDALKKDSTPSTHKDDEKAHRWRLCPIGKHYVRTHPENIRPSKKHPDGEVITRHGHCASNPSHKNFKDREVPTQDLLSFEELRVITKTSFSNSNLTGPSPKANVLAFPRADEFDQQIRGWVQYWNEVFNAKDPLDPNLVKALIASESSFKPELHTPTNEKKVDFAHGLMQLTGDTLSRINGHTSELKDHFIKLTLAEVMDPSANICAGVRWLFMKYAGARERIAQEKLNRPATWDDAVAEYKGVLKGIIENKKPDLKGEMPIFRDFYRKLLES